MAIQWRKQRKHQDTPDSLLDRLIDGKVVDTSEMYDRWLISRQLELIIGAPQKQTTKRVR
jgi:hypothetical protein